MSNDTSLQSVALKTEEEAKYFGAYVELLVEFANGKIEESHNIKDLTTYYEKIGVIMPSYKEAALSHIQKAKK